MPRHATKHHSEVANMERTCKQSLLMYLLVSKERQISLLSLLFDHKSPFKAFFNSYHLLSWRRQKIADHPSHACLAPNRSQLHMASSKLNSSFPRLTRQKPTSTVMDQWKDHSNCGSQIRRINLGIRETGIVELQSRMPLAAP